MRFARVDVALVIATSACAPTTPAPAPAISNTAAPAAGEPTAECFARGPTPEDPEGTCVARYATEPLRKIMGQLCAHDLAAFGHPGLRFEICYERTGTTWTAASSMLVRDGAAVLFSSSESSKGQICEVDLELWAALPAIVHEAVESRVVCVERRSLADF